MDQRAPPTPIVLNEVLGMGWNPPEFVQREAYATQLDSGCYRRGGWVFSESRETSWLTYDSFRIEE